MPDKSSHVLFINVDQWSGPFFGYEGHPVIMTPTIDQLAANGIIFDNCHSTCPVCIPARRSLMTGTYPKTHGDRVYSDRMRMPDAVTMPQAFRDSGYQTVAVGKLHVYPQRSRIGFDEVILQEEGRYEFGEVDDYQIWLGEQGYAGMEFSHGMGNNTYYTRPWPLPETAHPTCWTTNQAIKQIKRRDPGKPGFFYVSYQFPHPPLVPLRSYLDMYSLEEIPDCDSGDWQDGSPVMRAMHKPAENYSDKEIRMAKRAYYAQCTLIDHQIRLLIGTLREEGLIKNTIIVFTSDHGDMLFDHGMCAKRCFYENSSRVPLIFSGAPLKTLSGRRDHRTACLEDIMPSLLELCGIGRPASVEGLSLFSDRKRQYLFGEISEGIKATRMIYDGRYKLVYYPYGNVIQLFDVESDRNERHNLADSPDHTSIKEKLEKLLVENLYGDEDRMWIKDGRLAGRTDMTYEERPDYGFSNQRGLHWPAPHRSD